MACYDGIKRKDLDPECRRAYFRDRQRITRTPERNKNAILKNRYGIDLADYNRMHDEQDGLCAICKRPEAMTGKSLAVDHDHTTGAVRGLLCVNCNQALGKFQDDTARLEAAIAYLRKS